VPRRKEVLSIENFRENPNSYLYQGAEISSGQGWMMALAVGADTNSYEIEKSLIMCDGDTKTPL